MFQDIGVSKTLIPEYEKYCEIHHVNDIGKINYIIIKFLEFLL